MSVNVNERGAGDEYAEDGSVDLKGNPVLRSKRGGWRACSFVVVYEVFERMAFYGISSNLITYLTTRLHQGTVVSARNVTNWVGAGYMASVFGAYIADAHLGRYWTFLIASVIYLCGMCALTLAVSVPGLKPPACSGSNSLNCKKPSTTQLAVFFVSLYALAVGTAGTKPNISTIGADQFDEFEPKEKAYKLSFFNWWTFSIFFGTLFANTVLVYLQDNVGWTLGYGLPAVGLALSIVIFLVGTPFYRHKLPTGSPFTKIANVIVASIRKWRVPIPSDPKELYELDLAEYSKKGKYKIESTPTLSFFNKASVQTGSTSQWMLCSVSQVEETKQILRIIPVWVATFIPSMMFAQSNTLFVKQGTTLMRDIGGFEIPPASLSAFVTIFTLVSLVLYDRVFVKIMQKWTKNPRGITLLQRLGVGLVFHIIIMVVASLTERHRLSVARDHGMVGSGKQVPLSIFVLLPQYILLGIADAFLMVAEIEFYYDQSPESMKSLGTSFSLTSPAIGNFLSSFLVTTVAHITKKDGHEGWIQNNLNASHLDYYYAFLAILTFSNFMFFLFVTKFYVYKAEVSDSMTILGEELKGSSNNMVVVNQDAPNSTVA